MISDIARRWIVANALAMLFLAVASLLGYAARTILAVEAENAAFAARAAYVAIEVVLVATSMAIFASLTGSVIKRIIPALPWRRWMTVHLLVGLVTGVATGLVLMKPAETEPMDWRDAEMLILGAAFVVIAGSLAGAAFGSIQAYVLRPVASGTGLWVFANVAAMVILLGIVVASFALLTPQQTLANELAQQAVLAIAGVIGAVAMLPALLRLQPR
jgi:hypothetical protein